MATVKKKKPESFTGSFHVPENENDWRQVALNGRLTGKTIHQIVNMESGSNVRKRQFLMFRVLWTVKSPADELTEKLSDYGLDAHIPSARNILASSSEFAKYTAIVAARFPLDGMNEHKSTWAGIWMLVARYQSFCIDPEHSDDHRIALTENYESKDEVLANTALLLFLETLEMLIPNRTATWTMQRVRFEAKFGAPAKYTALTDGALWSRVKHRILGLIEVKRNRRLPPFEEEVQMQESAELVGWQLNSNPEDGIFANSRIMISQNGDQIFLSFAMPDAEYERYLRVGLLNGADPFMRVKTYGPFWTWDAGHMQGLAAIVLSIFLAGNAATRVTGSGDT